MSDVLASTGQALDASTRDFMESRFSQDFFACASIPVRRPKQRPRRWVRVRYSRQ
ncbi:hypothetical protein LP420_18640 [Massilia sp. B-10]|nr:hypothetical protein LP420_18640 [Massilia sp. B-10]